MFTVATVKCICYCVTDEALVVMEYANPELCNVSLKNYTRDFQNKLSTCCKLASLKKKKARESVYWESLLATGLSIKNLSAFYSLHCLADFECRNASWVYTLLISRAVALYNSVVYGLLILHKDVGGCLANEHRSSFFSLYTSQRNQQKSWINHTAKIIFLISIFAMFYSKNIEKLNLSAKWVIVM